MCADVTSERDAMQRDRRRFDSGLSVGCEVGPLQQPGGGKAGDQPPECGADIQQRHIGYVAQEGALFPHLTVSDNIRFGLAEIGRAAAMIVDNFLELVDLDGLAKAAPSDLAIPGTVADDRLAAEDVRWDQGSPPSVQPAQLLLLDPSPRGLML